MPSVKRHSIPKASPLKGVASKCKGKKPQISISSNLLKALGAGIPDELVGRGPQLDFIRSFLESTVSMRKPGCLYVSGAPGTGKTACLKKLISSLPNFVKVVWVNCMISKTGPDVFKHILKQVVSKENTGSCSHAKQRLDQIIKRSKSVHLIVLDEIDYLEMKHQDVLYSLMEWPALEGSHVVLIGVANSLDLTDRILPRLNTFPGLKPESLHFPPYSRDEIRAIISTRIDRISGSESFISPAAVQLLSCKVSSVAGDARKALAVCSRSIEVASKLAAAKSPRSNHPEEETCSIPSAAPQPTVGPALISSVLGEVYEHPVTQQSNNMLDSMPIHQKLAICAQLIGMRVQRVKEVAVSKLTATYSKVCQQHHVTPVASSEFLGLLTMLETQGIVAVKKQTAKQPNRVGLILDEEEIKATLLDDSLLALIMSVSS